MQWDIQTMTVRGDSSASSRLRCYLQVNIKEGIMVNRFAESTLPSPMCFLLIFMCLGHSSMPKYLHM